MKKFVKWSLVVGGGLTAVLVAAVLLLPSLIDVAEYRSLIQREAGRILGRPVEMGKDIRLSFFPWIEASVADVRVGNPPDAGFGADPLFSAQFVSLRLKVSPLLRQRIEVGQVVLKSPRVMLERKADGTANWSDMDGKAAARRLDSSGGLPPASVSVPPIPLADLSVGSVSVTDGILIYMDHVTGRREELARMELTIPSISLENPISFSAKAVIRDAETRISGRLGPLGNPIGAGDMAVEISLAVTGLVEAGLKGKVSGLSAAPAWDLAVNLPPFSPKKLLAIAGLPFPFSLADDKALDRVGFTGRISGSTGEIRVTGGEMILDDARISLEAVAMKPGELPQGGSIQLTALLDRLDLGRYLPADAPVGDATAVPAPEKERTPLPLALPEGLGLNARVEIGSLVTPWAEPGNVRLEAVADKGQAKVSVFARYRKEEFHGTADLGPATADHLPVRLSLKGPAGLEIGAKGRLNPNVENTDAVVEMAVDLAPFSPRVLLAALDQPFPWTTTDPNALSRTAFSGGIALAGDWIAVSDGKLTLDDTLIGLSGRLSPGPAPDIRFEANLDHMDADRYLPPTAPKTDAPPSPSSKPAPPPAKGGAPAYYDILRRLSLDGNVGAERLTVKRVRMERVQARFSGKGGRFSLNPMTLNLYGGAMNLSGDVNFSGDAPRTGLNFTMEDIQTGGLLRDALAKDFLDGAATGKGALSAEGDTVESVKSSLDGEANVILTNGVIKGMDLVAMMRNVAAAYTGNTGLGGQTKFSTLSVACKSRKGRVSVGPLEMRSPLMATTAEGTADLSSKALDFRVTPTFLASGDQNGFMVPVVVGGTFDAPVFRPDLEGMVRMVSKQTMEEIVKDPKKGLGDLLDRQRDSLKKILKPSGNSDKEQPADEKPDSASPDKRSPGGIIKDVLKFF